MLLLPRFGDPTDWLGLGNDFCGRSSGKFSNKYRAKSLRVFEEKPKKVFLASHISCTSFFNFIRAKPISSLGRPRFGGEAMTRN